jgi:hypothetical protein
MRVIVGALIQSLKSLSNVFVFLLFVFVLFGILGVQTYSGSMYYFCRTSEKPFEDGTWPIAPGIDRVCNADGFGDFDCPKDTFCGALADYNLPLEQDDVINIPLINFGIATFDNLY